MPWTLSGSTIPWIWGRSLLGSRSTLSTSIQRSVENRREADRHFLVAARGRSNEPDWALLNLSVSGLAIQVRGEAPFSRGERFAISVLGGSLRAEVEGEVRWTRSNWRHEPAGSDRKVFYQTAGFAIIEPLSPEMQRRWQLLQSAVEDRSALVGIGLVSRQRSTRNGKIVLPFRSQASGR